MEVEPAVKSSELENHEEFNKGVTLFFQQFGALYVKRWHCAKRDRRGTFAQVPLIFCKEFKSHREGKNGDK